MPHQLLKIGEDLIPLRRPVIELGEITPQGHASGISGIDGMRGDDVATAIAGEPARVAGDELAVPGGVVDDEIHDRA